MFPIALSDITFSTTGNSADFGDMNGAKSSTFSGQSAVRGIVAGGNTAPADQNNIDYFNSAFY